MAEFDSSGPPRIKVKKKEALWLYSLTDLTFILMAFFALMLSMSKPDREQYDKVASAVQAQQNPAADKLANLSVVAEDLEKAIKQLKLEDDIRVRIDINGLLLEFSERLVFASGSAQASADFEKTTDKILSILSQAPDRYTVSIEGHTDDLSIQSKLFKSNWELSAARGITLLKLLKDRGLDEKRMRVQAVAHTQPKIPIEGKTGQSLQEARRANRRVVIRLD